MSDKISNNNKNKVSEGFSDIDRFIENGEESLEKKEEKLEKDIESEKNKISSLEEKKQKLEKIKNNVDEKISSEKEKLSEMQKEEKDAENAEKQAEKIRDDILRKKASVKDSISSLKKIFSRGKPLHSGSKEKKGFFREIYEDHYKKLLIIPFILLLFAFVQISYQYSTTGDFVNRGVDLKGGVTLTIPEKSYDINELRKELESSLGGDISIRSISSSGGILIEASDVSSDELIQEVEETIGTLEPEEYSVEQMGSTLGASFFMEIATALVIAFLLMGIVVFIAFRVPVPSLAVIVAALSDIIITLAIFNLTGAKLGKGGIAAFLMLIGYSVDTDILLSTKVLKRNFGSIMERIYSAMRTGITMNITTIAAIGIAFFVTDSEVIRQIMLILLIGLFVDIINTWIQNVGLLRLYLEKRRSGR